MMIAEPPRASPMSWTKFKTDSYYKKINGSTLAFTNKGMA